ncbi:MAG: matrixin family metalloprotease [Acidobacteria bacterium]|nr:matrixin family metalloprotease [Acidobacteriota bacterium]MBI3662559.1 matrixin family metalloprotease [Acidobacteriota bacterium]
MKDARKNVKRGAACLLALAVLVQPALAPSAEAYVLNRNIQGAAPGSCPVPQRFAATTPGIVDRRWSTSLSVSPQTVFTDVSGIIPPETPVQQIDRAIRNSFDVWTSVGTSLTPASLGAALTQISTQSACNFSDGLNSICFNQSDPAFTTGVLAFTRVNSWDALGFVLGTNPPTTIIGEIVDADIYFRTDGALTFATREALAAHQNSFDLESVMIHELGHWFGFSHSAVLRAMMYPFAPPQGTFTGGVRCPTPNTGCDLPLADDDRAGLRVLYPNPADPNVGTISGFILPANPSMSLAGLPSPAPGRSVTGIFGAHVVAVDAATGAVVAGTFGGWSCNPANLPSQFDGFYKIEGLPVGRSYKIFVEPLDSPTDASDIQNAIDALCWQVAKNDVCTPPAVNTNFTTKIKPQ